MSFSKYSTVYQVQQKNILNRSPLSVDPESTLQNAPSVPRVVYFAADSGGCFWWRIGHMANHLSAYGRATCMTLHSMVHDHRFFLGVDCVVLQRQINDVQVQYVEELRKLSDYLRTNTGKGFKIIWEVDDIVAPASAIPDYNECKVNFRDESIENNMSRIFKVIDEMTVPSQAMRQHYGVYFNFRKISVIPNYMPRDWHDRYFDMAQRIKNYKSRKKPVILYSGSQTHFNLRDGMVDDFTHVIDKIYETRNEFEWTFLGGYPIRLKNLVDSGLMKFHPWCPLFKLPSVMNAINPEVCIAPLADNIFNHAKANIKLTESGVLGIPCVSQNLQCYRDGLWKFDTGDQMIQQIRKILLTKNTFEVACKKAREYADTQFIEDHMDEAILIYTTEFDDPRRWNNESYKRNNVKMVPLEPVVLT